MTIAEEVYSLLTKRRYNRGKPYLQAELLSRIDVAVNANQPIKLIGFWGTGPKSKPNWADEESCKFLNKLKQEITKIYPPSIDFIFIFATLHGIHNGYEEASIHSYVEGMTTLFEYYQFSYIYLDTLWDKYDISFEKINDELTKKPSGWWQNIAEHEIIENNASHRNRKYPPELAAQKYYIMRDLEKEMFQKEFPGFIFHAFSDPALQVVLPNMPTLYFYGRESWSNAPWFVEGVRE